MRPRFYCIAPLAAQRTLALPAGAARHVQVLRMQPGDGLTLFDGSGGEWDGTIERMGRSEVTVRVGQHSAIEREAPRAVHLAVGMPANERMDWLVEKATELGVASIHPLITAHGVLRLAGERAEKKRAHWQAIAVSACEQCGRNRVPLVHPVRPFATWIDAPSIEEAERFVLSLADGAHALRTDASHASDATKLHGACVLSGPEGGLGAAEEREAIARGFAPRTLGPRVLRAETAALAALALLTST
ncbi:16S rRNA (uracil(1498)-N(3))-methyltransferase [Variovorax defluvii]|uniref:Ribosomal RNA small subunit methyltransferase E n=1 Tax=Variovorax defluvii TaxID=913761 RepID=A0ABP8HQK3_9BURK